MNKDEMTSKIKECLSDLNIQTGDYIVIFEIHIQLILL